MTTEPITYEFEETTCTEIVSCMAFDSDFLRRTDGLILPTYFPNNVERVFAHLAMEHHKRYGESPSTTAWVELVKQAFKTKLFREDQKVDAVTKLGELSKLTVRSRSWLMDSIAEFAKQQAITNALFKSAEAIGKMTDPERFQRAESIMRPAFDVALKTEDEDYDFLANIEQRTAERLAVASGARPKTGITTGVAELDEALFHKGWGRKELSIFMGGAKASKSFHLSFIAVNAWLDGKNVLFITLENSREVVSMRMDAQLSKIAISEQFASPHGMDAGVKAEGAKTKGTLRIREAPANSFRPSDLRRMLDEYRTKGVTFDEIVIDYLDLMAPDVATREPREDSRTTWVGVRAIMVKENAAGVSATQTNREGHKSAVVKAEHVAEDFNKIRTADLVISINRTDDEKAESKARLGLAASRNQKDSITIFVKQNLDLGLAIEEVESVE